jgi:hypothetical protein
MSVSLPFFTVSLQLRQVPPVQVALAPPQSVSAMQILVGAQSVPEVPPQSTSVSEPFFTPSVAVGAWQAFTELVL